MSKQRSQFFYGAIGIVGMLAATPAVAQMFDQPYSHSPGSLSPGAAALMRQIENGSDDQPTEPGVNYNYADYRSFYTISSNSVGTLAEVTAILEEGSSGDIVIGVDQDSQGNQTSETTAMNQTITDQDPPAEEPPPDDGATIDDVAEILDSGTP